jgi:hypothetical protein
MQLKMIVRSDAEDNTVKQRDLEAGKIDQGTN